MTPDLPACSSRSAIVAPIRLTSRQIQRMDVGVHRLGVRRHEDARRGLAHLVLVEPDLREPLAVDRARHRARLLLREHEPVAVVVVADVVVVEPGHPAALVARAHVLAVPLGLHGLAVGVERGNEQEHDFPQPPRGLLVLGGGQGVRPLHRHLRRADLGRVDVAGHQQHQLALARQGLALGLAQAARVGDPPRHLLDARQVRDVLLRRDDRHDHLLAERRLAEVLQGHARRGRVQHPEVRRDLAVVGERAVGADRDAEELRGRWNGGGGRRRRAGHGGHEERREPAAATGHGAPPPARSSRMRRRPRSAEMLCCT